MAATYYVETNGSDGNTGLSWEQSWTSISKVNSTVVAGDTVFFGSGNWYNVRINVPSGGTSSTDRTAYMCSTGTVETAHLTKLYGGEVVAATFTVYDTTGAEWIWKAHYNPVGSNRDAWWGRTDIITTVVEDGVLLRPRRVLKSGDAWIYSDPLGSDGNFYVSQAGDFYHNAINDTLYIWPLSRVNPNTLEIMAACQDVIGSRNEGADYITIYGIDFLLGHYLISPGSSDGGGGDHWLIENCNLNYSSNFKVSNPALISHGQTYGASVDSWSRFNTIKGCSLFNVRGDLADGEFAPHGGAGISFYSVRETLIEDCYFAPSVWAAGINFKYGRYQDFGISAVGNVVRNCFFDGQREFGMWFGDKMAQCSVYANIAYKLPSGFVGYEGSDDTDSMGYVRGGNFICNNTIYASTHPYTFKYAISGTGSIVKYNLFYDYVPAAGHYDDWTQAIAWNGHNPSEFIKVDSNLYYDPVTSFNANCLGSEANWTQWKSCGYDTNGTVTTNPGLNDPENLDFSRPSSSQEMDRTYGGKTWTRYGAWQPAEAPSMDSCILITGKISLPTSDTCYCIDSLRYNFANWDTLIHTNGKDRIRIYGYNRGVIVYDIDDAGTNSTVTDAQRGSVVIHVSMSDSILIKGLRIIPGTVDDSVRGFVCVNMLSSVEPHLTDDSLIAGGFSSRAYQQGTTYDPGAHGGASFNQLLENSYFGTVSKGYHRRDALYGATIRLSTDISRTDRDGASYKYNYKIRNCNIFTIHTGIGSAGINDDGPDGNDTIYATIIIDTVNIVVDTRNDLFLEPLDDVNNSTADPFGIGIDGADSLSRITGVTITSGTSNYGGDGMLLQHIKASPTNRMEVYNNVINIGHGRHPRIAEGKQAAVGFYLRNYGAKKYVTGLHLFNNIINILLDEDTATHHIGRYAEGIRAGFEYGANGNLIENNRINEIPTDSASRTTCDSLFTSGISFVQRDSATFGHAGTGNNIFRNNYYRVPRNPIWFGDTRIGYGANNCTIIGDTANTLYPGDSTFARFHQTGTYWGHHYGNTLQDMVLQGYADPNDVIKGMISELHDQYGKQLSYLRSVVVNFKNSLSNNINGGTVWAINDYGDRINLPNTNASGNSSDTIRFRFFGYDALTGDGYVVEDSNSYSPFIFWAKLGNDSASTSATINWTTSQLINIQLQEETPITGKRLKGLSTWGTEVK